MVAYGTTSRTVFSPNLDPPAPASVSLRCCLCDDDDAEPVGLGADFARGHGDQSILVMRCNACGIVYRALRLGGDEHCAERTAPVDTASDDTARRARTLGLGARRRLARAVRGLHDRAWILEVGCGSGERLRALRALGPSGWVIEGEEASGADADAAARAGFRVYRDGELDRAARYDVVLLAGSLSATTDPVRLLATAGTLLHTDGRVVVLSESTAAACFRVFRGRHWDGYRLPDRAYWFDAPTIAALADRAGLVAARIDRVRDGDQWVASIHNLLTDWRAGRWLVDRFAPGSVAAPALFGIVEALGPLGGSLLLSELRRNN